MRTLFLTLSLSINLLLLGFFKYFYFVTDSVSVLAAIFSIEIHKPTWNILLPIGISFYTFHSISYIVDVYRGALRPVRNLLLFADYVIFFPQLVAGPILRANEMIWQLNERPAFDIADIQYGLTRIMGGLFLKVVLADNIAGYVNDGFAMNPADLTAIDVLTLAFLFGFQIYFDFAGYSHIALGTARLMGVRFPENFHYPYLASSPRIFWRRWHISLSSWIRDYIYLPLTGVKVIDRTSTGGIGIDGTGQVGKRSAIFALFATWAIMGLWHGANWTFFVWGLWHATLVAGHRLIQAPSAKLPALVRDFGGWTLTLLLVMIGWIPFRAQTVESTLVLWGHLLDPTRYTTYSFRESVYVIAATLMILVAATPFVADWLRRFGDRYPLIWRPVLTTGWVVALTLVIVYLRPINQFIYFQF